MSGAGCAGGAVRAAQCGADGHLYALPGAVRSGPRSGVANMDSGWGSAWAGLATPRRGVRDAGRWRRLSVWRARALDSLDSRGVRGGRTLRGLAVVAWVLRRWAADLCATVCPSPVAPPRDAGLAHRRDITQSGQMPPPPGATGHAARVRGGEDREAPSGRPTARAGDCSSDARRVYVCLARVNVSPRDYPAWIRFRVESSPWRAASRHHGIGRRRARFGGTRHTRSRTRTGSPFARSGRTGRSRAD